MKKVLDKKEKWHYIIIKQTIDWNKRLIKTQNKKGGSMIKLGRSTRETSLTLRLEAMPIFLEINRGS